VRHGHFEVNGRKNNIPSSLTSVGDVVRVRPNSQNKVYFKDRSQVMQSNRTPGWLSLNLMNLSGAVQSEPGREDIEIPLNEQLIVEYYSR
jgi:small subunit ribosomal protein S4